MGRDILSGIIHGARISLSVAFVAVSISTIIGVILGGIAGFFGDHSLKIPIIRFILLPFCLFFCYFYAFYIRQISFTSAFQTGIAALLMQILISLCIILVIFILFYGIEKLIRYLTNNNKEIPLAVDFWISRLIELKIALPTLLLILTISSVAKPSLLLIELIIGLTSWTGIARLVRAEMLKIRTLPYIEAGQALGFSKIRLLFLHGLRNAMTPVYVSIAFAMASAILLESSLSFLGLGVPIEYVTWGSLLQNARQDFSAWWLALFPGLMIFVTNMVFNLLGEGLRDYLDPR
jgi:peptide/nickel transport system permease protein